MTFQKKLLAQIAPGPWCCGQPVLALSRDLRLVCSPCALPISHEGDCDG